MGDFSDFHTFATHLALMSTPKNKKKKKRTPTRIHSESLISNATPSTSISKKTPATLSRLSTNSTRKRPLNLDVIDSSSDITMLFETSITKVIDSSSRTHHKTSITSSSSTAKKDKHQSKKAKLSTPSIRPLSFSDSTRTIFDLSDGEDEPNSPEFVPESELDQYEIPETPPPPPSALEPGPSTSSKIILDDSTPPRQVPQDTSIDNDRYVLSDDDEPSPPPPSRSDNFLFLKAKKSRTHRRSLPRPEGLPAPENLLQSKSLPNNSNSAENDNYQLDDNSSQLQVEPRVAPTVLPKAIVSRSVYDRMLKKLDRCSKRIAASRVSDESELEDPRPGILSTVLRHMKQKKRSNTMFLQKDCQWLGGNAEAFDRYMRLKVMAVFSDQNQRFKYQLLCSVLPDSYYGANCTESKEFEGPIVPKETRLSKLEQLYQNSICCDHQTKNVGIESEEVEASLNSTEIEFYNKKNDILPVGYPILLMYDKRISLLKDSFVPGTTQFRLYPDWKVHYLKEGARVCCHRAHYVIMNACNLVIE